MPSYSYQGYRDGRSCSGEIEGTDRRAALSNLRRLGIRASSLDEAGGRKTPAAAAQPTPGTLRLPRRIAPKDITAMTRQLATLLGAGFPLARALAFIQRQSDNDGLRELLGGIDAAVRAGTPLSDALAAHPRHFDSLYLSMIRAGEAGGILDTMLDRLAGMREADEALVSKIKGALTYPALMALAMAGSLVVLFSYVVPQFSLMFEQMGQALPTPTRIMMDIGAVFQNWWWALLLALALIAAAPLLAGRSAGGRLALDRLKLNLPLLGAFANQVIMARLCRILGTLLDSGVGLIATLESSRGVADNLVISRAIGAALKELREGRKLGETLAAAGVFPDLVCEMVSLGEESGQLGPMLLKVAEVYERQTDGLVKALTSILEPVMILIMGAVVGLVVMAMLMPIFSMNLLGG